MESKNKSDARIYNMVSRSSRSSTPNTPNTPKTSKNTSKNTTNTYSDLLFGSPVGTKASNCYAYALDAYANRRTGKLQPGELSGDPGSVDLASCRDLLQKSEKDAATTSNVLARVDPSPSARCPAGSYKIMAFLAKGEDYHWYRFHRDLLYRVRHPRTPADLAAEFGVPLENVQAPLKALAAGDLVLVRGANVWSHKAGHSPDGPLLKDACGKLIKDPRKACRNYGGGLDYSTMCSAFCYTKKNNMNGNNQTDSLAKSSARS